MPQKIYTNRNISTSSRTKFAGRARQVSLAMIASAALLTAGCGNTYRPVVSAINPVGPAGQPTKYAIALANTGPNTPGLLTFVDFSGDTVLSTPSVIVNPDPTRPLDFTLNSGGSTGYITNSAGLLNSFSTSFPSGLRTANIVQTTLLTGANPVAINVFNTNANGQTIFISQQGRTSVATLNATPALLQELSVAQNPVYVVGIDGATRAYAISQGSGGGNGQVAAIETTTVEPTISNVIPVGTTPVYGVMSADGNRVYIVNQGSGNVSVINVQTNQPDATTPTIPASGTLGVNPVWAQFVPTLNELLVLSQGSGGTAGTLSVISVPLCNAIVTGSNPNCNAANLTDAVGFGTIVATVPVGINPTMISVLSDASRAYVVNSGSIAGNVNGSVSVVNLLSNTVTTTIASTPNDSGSNAATIYGHPNTIITSNSTPTGKVYTTSTDSKYMTVIRTDLDAVDTHIPLQGYGVRVLVTAP